MYIYPFFKALYCLSSSCNAPRILCFNLTPIRQCYLCFKFQVYDYSYIPLSHNFLMLNICCTKHLEEYGELLCGTYVLLLYKCSSIHRTYTLEMNLCYMAFIYDEDLMSVFFLCKDYYGREDERHYKLV